MALGIGWLLHLVLDAMWVSQEVLLWPFFGFEIPAGEAPFWSLAWERALSDPWRWIKEVTGFAYLTWLWLALGLTIEERRRDLWTTGRLPGYVGDET